MKSDLTNELGKTSTRRTFLKSAGTTAVAGLATAELLLGSGVREASAAPMPTKWDLEVDVLVAGSGPTGLPAAIAAADKGASVLVVEHGKEVGGCGVIAGGILNIGGGTRIQKLNGVVDTPDMLYAKLSDYRDPYAKRNDPALLRAFCDANPGTLDWLEQRGVRFTEMQSRGTDAMHTQVYHYIVWEQAPIGLPYLKNVSGAGLIKPLEEYARKHGVQILVEHKLTGLVRDESGTGRVLGAEVQTPNGTRYIRAKKGVILGTGSWKGNRFLRKLFDSRITDDIAASGEPFVKADGSGIVAGLAAGGVLVGDRAMDSALFRFKFGTKHYNFPLNSPYGAPGLGIVGPRRADVIFVNKAGKRFVSEEDAASFGKYSFFDAAFAQEGRVLWTIFDDATAKRNRWEVTPPVTEADSAFSAATISELAQRIGVPADALGETVKKYNGYVDAGKDAEFDRPKPLLKSKIETPPFHAVWISLYVHDTCGGLAINAKSQVLDTAGKVIRGLYAGGEAAGGLDFAGMLRGVIEGRIAGETAAADA